MRSCKEISVLLSEAHERPLGRAERWSVKLHLLLCHGCRNFRAQIEFLRAAIKHYRDNDRHR